MIVIVIVIVETVVTLVRRLDLRRERREHEDSEWEPILKLRFASSGMLYIHKPSSYSSWHSAVTFSQWILVLQLRK